MQLFCPTVHPSNLGFATLLLKKKSNLENLPISFHGKLGVSKLSPPAVARRRMIGSRKRKTGNFSEKRCSSNSSVSGRWSFSGHHAIYQKKEEKTYFFRKSIFGKRGVVCQVFFPRGGGGGGGGSYRNSFTGGRGKGKALHRRRGGGGGGLFFICLQQISQERRKYRKLSLFFAQGSSINN